jgi:hypothetical protein
MAVRSTAQDRKRPRDPRDLALPASDGGRNTFLLIVRLLARQAAQEFLDMPHEMDGHSVEPPRSAAR